MNKEIDIDEIDCDELDHKTLVIALDQEQLELLATMIAEEIRKIDG